MTTLSHGAPAHRRVWRRLLSLGAVAAVSVALAGCGSSSKPAYCTDRTNLDSSIKQLTSLNPSSGLSGLEAQLKKIQTNANNLVKSAKNDFPQETGAIKSSLDTLTSTLKGLSGSPSVSEVKTIATQASDFVNSVQAFAKATGSKCR